MTPSEKYIAHLCRISFLPFWSFPNPIGKNGKELCDLLVVCANTVIIISVKDIKFSEHKNQKIQQKRWSKKAIESSINQIKGAERHLNSVDSILLKDRKTSIKLPKKDQRVIYRIAIAFGSDKDYQIPIGNYQEEFVHIFDEKSTATILSELDTITDFTNYLFAKEKFLKNCNLLVACEVDFLAIYIETTLEFDQPVDVLTCPDDLWESYLTSQEYYNWRETIKPSFIWDYMINHLFNYHITDSTSQERRDNMEFAVRLINQENRMNRIELGICLDDAINKKSNGRMLLPQESANHLYVFIPLTQENWEGKEQELELRCIVARKLNPSIHNVIGIAIGSNTNGESVFDICHHYIPNLTDEFLKNATKIQEEFGYFQNPKMSNSSEFRDNPFGKFGLKNNT